MSEINKIIKKYKSTIDDFGDQEWYTDDVKRAMKEYAEYYAKIAIKNTRYRAIDIVHNADYYELPVTHVVQDIQNIDNNSVLPEHE